MSNSMPRDGELLQGGKGRPGLKPGQKHSGSFIPNDPRILKGGRNSPLYQMKQAACSDLDPKALEAYKAVLADPSHKDHAAVARDVLNRVYGFTSYRSAESRSGSITGSDRP